MNSYTNNALAISSTLGIIFMLCGIVAVIYKHFKEKKMERIGLPTGKIEVELVIGTENKKFIRIKDTNAFGSVEISEANIERVQVELAKFKLMFQKLKAE